MVESDLSVRHFNRDHHPCVTFDFSDARERQHLSSGHLYSTRVLCRAQRKKVGRGGERGKKNETVSLRGSISEAPTTPVHVGYRIFLLGFLRNRLLRLLSRILARHVRAPTSRGCVVKAIFEIYNERRKEKRKKWVFSRHVILLDDTIVHKLIITLKN